MAAKIGTEMRSFILKEIKRVYILHCPFERDSGTNYKHEKIKRIAGMLSRRGVLRLL